MRGGSDDPLKPSEGVSSVGGEPPSGLQRQLVAVVTFTRVEGDAESDIPGGAAYRANATIGLIRHAINELISTPGIGVVGHACLCPGRMVCDQIA